MRSGSKRVEAKRQSADRWFVELVKFPQGEFAMRRPIADVWVDGSWVARVSSKEETREATLRNAKAVAKALLK